MTREQVFQAWAPDGARWSPWAKPVVFAHLADDAMAAATLAYMPEYAPDLSWLPPADGTTALVVDLPDAQGVLFGLRAADRGYRPVPLYNAVPAPAIGGPLGAGAGVVVDMSGIVAALRAGAEELQHLRLEWESPPVFLLDARRRTGARAPTPGVFDNRSVSFPTDFPSANTLLAAGVQRVIFVQSAQGDAQPQADVAHTLRRWQDAGITLLTHSADLAEPLRPLTVGKPPWYGYVWHGLLARLGLKRNPLGGFGGFIPVPSSGGGSSFG